MRRRGWTWAVVAMIVVLFLACGGCGLLSLAAVLLAPQRQPLAGWGSGVVAVVEIKGVIVGGEPSPWSTTPVAFADRVVEDIKRASGDPAVKAIVLDIDSPGGSVVASVDIYRALKACTKPIVASFGETAASGGYYVACAAQAIVVRPATLTGSIGVRWDFNNAEELLKKLGVQLQVVRSGPHKDQGSYHRPLTAEELGYLQSIVDEAYDDFVLVVSEGRKLSEERVRALADGRVYSGKQAVALALADAEGDLKDAVRLAGERSGIKGEPRMLRYEHEQGLLLPLLGQLMQRGRAADLDILRELLGAGDTPRLRYLYTGP